MEFVHVPVLLQEVLQYLEIRPDGIYADGTAGGAGHKIPETGRHNVKRQS